RKSSITATDANIESATTININRAVSSFTHTITYTFGSLSGTIATKTSLTSVGFTIPSTFYAQIPNAKTGIVTLTCTTYNGNTSLGSSTTNFTVTAIAEKCRPTVSATIKDVNATTIALSGNSSKLIKYKSTARITPVATAKNSATIKSIVIKAFSTNYTVSGSYIDFANVVSETFEIIATDSRGYTNTEYILNPTIIQYIALSVTAKFERLSATSNQVKVAYNGNFFNGNFGTKNNSLTVSWSWKLRGASNWTNGGSLTPTISSNTFSGSITLNTTQEFDYQKDYDFILSVADVLSENSSQNPVLMGTPYYDYGKDSSGKNYFNVNGDLYSQNKKIFDLLYPVGSVYMSTSSTNPATLFGGTWTQISGRFLYCTTTSKTTGGESTHTHTTGNCTLTINQIPSHTHSFTAIQRDTTATTLATGSYGYVSKSTNTGYTGGGAAHNHGATGSSSNLPPWFSVYCWYRTA
ncbi:MAG: DUF859 family phage minor structural protein, partial [Clostridia bacterium]